MGKNIILEREIAMDLLNTAIAIKPALGNSEWTVKNSRRYDYLLNECRRMIDRGQDCTVLKSKVVSVGSIHFMPRSVNMQA